MVIMEMKKGLNMFFDPRVFWMWVLCLSLCGTLRADDSLRDYWLHAVRDFGLVGDGKTDNSEALEMIFRSGKSVYIPEGVYRFTQTVRVAARTKIYGESGSWNPNEQTVLLYDGPEGEIALRVEDAHNFQMRRVTVHGNGKAGIGLYWNYSTNDAILEDVAIRGTLDHGLYVTRTWYAHFNRLHVRHNFGNGVTLDRDVHEGLAKGAVNMVNFHQCAFHGNGQGDDYDGDFIYDTGYGIGILGGNTVVNVSDSTIEKNGGPGIYIYGHPNNVTFRGCYIEMNSWSLFRKGAEIHGIDWREWRTLADREPVGRLASIVIDTNSNSQSIVFDNCYIHPGNGIWIRGDGGHAIQFRHMFAPAVIWSENDRWVFHDVGSRLPVVSSNIGVIIRDDPGELASVSRIGFHDPEGVASGHPGFTVDQGVRRLLPRPRQGLDLYVNAGQGLDSADGRRDDSAWKSLNKVSRLLRDLQIDTPVNLYLKGNFGSESLVLQNLQGVSQLRIILAEGTRINQLELASSTVEVIVQGSRGASIREIEARAPAWLSVSGMPLADTRIRARGGALVALQSNESLRNDGGRLVADSLSKITLNGVAFP